MIFSRRHTSMSGFYTVRRDVAGLAANMEQLDGQFAGSPPVPLAYQFAAAKGPQDDAVAAGARASAKGGAKGANGPGVNATCRFGIKCTIPACAFQHPKGFRPVCTMGRSCLGPKVCPYKHPKAKAQQAKPPKAPKAQQAKPPKAPKAQQAKPPKPPKAQQAKPPKPPKAQQAKPPKPPKAQQAKPPKAPKAQQAKLPKAPKAQQAKPPKAPKAQPPCRYGKACHRPDCRYTHLDGDTRDGLVCQHGASCHGNKSGKCPFTHTKDV